MLYVLSWKTEADGEKVETRSCRKMSLFDVDEPSIQDGVKTKECKDRKNNGQNNKNKME